MEQLIFEEEVGTKALLEEQCMWKSHSVKDLQIVDKNLAEKYNPTAYSLCEVCDGTEECGKRLNCGTFFLAHYGE